MSGDQLQTIPLEIGSIIVATGFDSYTPEEGEFGYGTDAVVTLPDFKEMVDSATGALEYKGRRVPQSRLRLLRRQPRPGRQRLLLPFLLHFHGARLDRGQQTRSEPSAVPPLSRHPAPTAPSKLLYTEGAQAGGHLHQVPRRRAPVVTTEASGRPLISVRDLLSAARISRSPSTWWS